MNLPEAATLPGRMSRHSERRSRPVVPTTWVRLRALWVNVAVWVQQSVSLRDTRREPSPEALVRAVRSAWPRYGDRHVARLLTRTARIPQLPSPSRAGRNPARIATIR